MRYLMILGLLSLSACGESTTSIGDTQLAETQKATGADLPSTINEARPARLIVPSDYDTAKQYPLVVMLHGYSANVFGQELIFGLEDQSTAFQFILVQPEGTRNSEKKQFWNATDECCDFENEEVDDVQYISDLITEAKKLTTVNPDHVTLIGHSNGGYMSNRYACEPIEPIHKFVNLAGLSWVDAAKCKSPQPVDVLHIHGTADETIEYPSNLSEVTADPAERSNANSFRVRVAGAVDLAERWAQINGCDDKPTIEIAVHDLSVDVEGAETDVLSWENCTAGSSTLWRANDVGHLWIDRTDAFQTKLAEFLTIPPQ